MARSVEIITEGSYARRKETCAGDSEADLLRKICPPEIPPGYKFSIKWHGPLVCEYGIAPDPSYVKPAAPKTAPHRVASAVLTDSKLKERAAELGIETKGRTREAILADVEAKEAATVAA